VPEPTWRAPVAGGSGSSAPILQENVRNRACHGYADITGFSRPQVPSAKPGRMRFASITTNTIAECESALRRCKAWPFPAAHQKTSGIAQTGSSAGAVQRRLVYPSRVCAPAYRSKRHRDERRPGRPRLLQFLGWGGSETLLPPTRAAQFLPKVTLPATKIVAICGHMTYVRQPIRFTGRIFFPHVESPRDGLRCPRRLRG